MRALVRSAPFALALILLAFGGVGPVAGPDAEGPALAAETIDASVVLAFDGLGVMSIGDFLSEATTAPEVFAALSPEAQDDVRRLWAHPSAAIGSESRQQMHDALIAHNGLRITAHADEVARRIEARWPDARVVGYEPNLIGTLAVYGLPAEALPELGSLDGVRVASEALVYVRHATATLASEP